MFGKKKKQNVKTFIDGREQEPEVPRPEHYGEQAETTAHEPSPAPVHEPPSQPVTTLPHIPGGVIAQIQLPPGIECYICFDAGFYADTTGRWHQCPKCNPLTLRKAIGDVVKKKPSQAVSSDEEEKPSKGNLYEFRWCEACQARNEVHKRKVKWQCEACGFEQEVK